MTEDRIDALLVACLDEPATDWTTRVDGLCTEHPELAPELRRRFRRMVELGLIEAPPGHGSIPERLGPYQLLRRLGGGAMGNVFLARDERLGREVALKVLRADYAYSETGRRRFQREMDAASRIEHPNLCTLYEAGEIDGVPFLAMRYVKGRTLSDWVAEQWTARQDIGGDSSRERERVRTVCHWFAQLARGLHEVHEAGLVHRDVKPSNVMIDEDGTPVLLDFGLAHIVREGGEHLTLTGDRLGTPAYMAPEQVRGQPEAIDRRTDVYGLGAALYECLTLQPPHRARTGEALYADILAFDPPSAHRVMSTVPADVSLVTATAMGKESRRRYPTALAMAEDLERVLRLEPIVARRPPLWFRGRRWMQRHPVVAGVTAALAVGLGLSLGLLLRTLEAERETRTLLERSREEERRSRAVALVARAEAVRGDPEVAFQVYRRALELASEPEVIAAVHDVLPDLQDWEPVHRVEAGVERPVGGRVESITRSPSGRWFIVAGANIKAAIHRADGSYWKELPRIISPQRPAIAFSPDESKVVVWSGPIEVFDLGGDEPRTMPGVPEADFKGGDERVTDFAWSNDGRIGVTIIRLPEGKARAAIFDAETGHQVGDGILLPNRCRGCAFLPDGRLVVANGIWSSDGAHCQVPFPTDGVGNQTRILLHGNRVMVVSVDGIQAYNALDGTLDWDHLRGPTDLTQRLTAVDIAPDGAVLAAFLDGEIWLIEASGRRLQPWSEGSSVTSAQFTLDGRRVLVGSFGGSIAIRDRNGDVLHRWQGHQNMSSCAPIGASAQAVLTASFDGAVKIWRPGPARGLPFRTGFARAHLVRLGDKLIVAAKDGRLLALDANGETTACDELPPGTFYKVHPHRDGHSVWVTDVAESTALWRWKPVPGERAEELQVDDLEAFRTSSLAHLESDSLLIGTGWRQPRRVLDLATLKVTPDYTLTRGDVHCAAALGGRLAVSLNGFGEVRVHDGNGLVVASGKDPDAVRTGERVSDARTLAISEDGRFAVVGRDDGSVSLWDLQTPVPERVERWPNHVGGVRSVAVSSDGSRIASISGGHLVVREVGQDEPLLEWGSSRRESLESVVFFGDDAVVTSGWRNSGVVRWWWWDPKVLRRRLDQVPVKKLNEQQEKRLDEILDPGVGRFLQSPVEEEVSSPARAPKASRTTEQHPTTYVAYPQDTTTAGVGNSAPLGQDWRSKYKDCNESRVQILIPAAYLPPVGGTIVGIEVSAREVCSSPSIGYSSLQLSLAHFASPAPFPVLSRTFADNSVRPLQVLNLRNQTITYPQGEWHRLWFQEPFAYNGREHLVLDFVKYAQPPVLEMIYMTSSHYERSDIPKMEVASGPGKASSPVATSTGKARPVRVRLVLAGTTPTTVVESPRVGGDYWLTGHPFTMSTQGAPGALVWHCIDASGVGLGERAGPVVYPGIAGSSWVTPGPLLFVLPGLAVPPEGAAFRAVDVPNDPAMVGLRLVFQSLVLDAAGPSWTNAVDATLR